MTEQQRASRSAIAMTRGDVSSPRTLSREAFAVLLAAAALSFVTLVNQFPVVFYDTSTYLDRAAALAKFLLGDSAAAQEIHAAMTGATGKATTGATYSNPFFLRPFTYSAFLVPFATPYTFILAPFAHALLTAYVLRRLLTSLDIWGYRPFAICIAALAALSSLPITVAWVMPDIFTGLLVVFSFAAVKSWGTRSLLGRAFDIGFMTFLVAVHLSHIPITLAIAVLLLLTSFVVKDSFRRTPIILGVVLPLVVAPMILTASNYVVAGKPVISESSQLFLLGRFVGNGATEAYLRTACPTKRYVLCSELDRLGDTDTHGSVMDYFLWGKGGAVGRLADPRLLDEAPELNRETLRAYPGMIVASSIANSVRQLLAFQVDDDILIPPASFVTQSLRDVSPELAEQYLASRQSRGVFPLAAARFLCNLGLALSACVIVYAVAMHRRDIEKTTWLFALFALNGVGANALAIGSLSEVHDRYQNRVIWLIPLMAVLFAHDLARRSPRLAARAATS